MMMKRQNFIQNESDILSSSYSIGESHHQKSCQKIFDEEQMRKCHRKANSFVPNNNNQLYSSDSLSCIQEMCSLINCDNNNTITISNNKSSNNFKYHNSNNIFVREQQIPYSNEHSTFVNKMFNNSQSICNDFNGAAVEVQIPDNNNIPNLMLESTNTFPEYQNNNMNTTSKKRAATVNKRTYKNSNKGVKKNQNDLTIMGNSNNMGKLINATTTGTCKRKISSTISSNNANASTNSTSREREKTQSVNVAFTTLRTLIPTEPLDRKLSKIETLRLASSYISHLSSQLMTDQPCSEQNLESTTLATSDDGDEDFSKDEAEKVDHNRHQTKICTFCLSESKKIKAQMKMTADTNNYQYNNPNLMNYNNNNILNPVNFNPNVGSYYWSEMSTLQ